MTRTSSSTSRSSSGRSSSISYGNSSSSSYSKSYPTYSSSSTTMTTPKQSIPHPSPSTPSKISPPPLHPSPTVSSNKTELGNKSSGGGFMSNVMDGFSFGVGSSIAHRVVGGIFGSPSPYPQSYPQTKKVETHHHHYPQKTQDITKPEYIPKPECKSLQEDYLKCVQSSNTDFQSSCDFSLNMFKDCETEHKTLN